MKSKMKIKETSLRYLTLIFQSQVIRTINMYQTPANHKLEVRNQK
jgi:hypothetical protein